MLYSYLLFFNHPATTEIYTLSLHDALPICEGLHLVGRKSGAAAGAVLPADLFMHGNDPRVVFVNLPPAFEAKRDRKSTRLNSSHVSISYAVFCLKKKKQKK